MSIEENFPVVEIQKLAKIESARRQFYRPIYSLHKWWARRPGVTFRGIGLSHFLAPQGLFKGEFGKGLPFYTNHNFSDKVVLDPFMGGGTTIVEMNRLGLKTIGIDLNPVAWWTVKKELDSFNETEFNNAYKILKQTIGKKIKSYYKTTCPECGSNQADVMYCFWVKKIDCPSCSEEVELFKYYIIGKKQRKDPHTKLICPKCKELFFSNKSVNSKTECPECKITFIPNNGNARNKIVLCSHCDQTFKLIEGLQRISSPLEANMIAIEYYCDNIDCKNRDYKKPTSYDIKLYRQAADEFDCLENDLLFPRDKIPSIGKTTNNLRNFNYTKFFELFNKRQLLSLSLLLEEINKISDFSIKEYFLAAFSSGLEFHTVLCPYNYTMKQIVNVFNFQSFLIPTIHVENNVWGTKKGNGTFKTYIKRVINAKKFCKNPFEVIESGKKKKKIHIQNDEIFAEIAESFKDLTIASKPKALLACTTSEDLSLSPLEIPSNSIDAVITDPPYFSTIQYSELADFYFVWLKLILSEKYDCFKQSLSPKFNEIVMNSTRKKDEENFLQGLTRVFSECNRVLKEDCPLIFTFHHKDSLAWASVLGAIFNSGFYITSVFPVVSEFRGRTVRSINYDAIIVCRKRLQTESIIWEHLEDILYDQLDDLSYQIRTNYHMLSKGDQMIILFGRCLEIVSTYPKVYENENEVSINDLMTRVLKIVDEKTIEEFLPNLDRISRIYLTVILDQEIWSLDELNKRIRHQQIEIEDFMREKFLRKDGDLYLVVKPEDRYDFLSKKLNRKSLNPIDKIHFIYHQYKHSGDYSTYLKNWAGDDEVHNICEFLTKKLSDSTYTKIKNSLTAQKRTLHGKL